jgi:hypothetical protein
VVRFKGGETRLCTKNEGSIDLRSSGPHVTAANAIADRANGGGAQVRLD